MWLFMITGLLGYISKLPFIGKVLSVLGFYYRKSTFLQILIKIRKIFVVFNALIGVYLVFKSVGFSTDNLIIGFTAVGESYFTMLGSMVKRLFCWFVELFDHKIVPNVPGDNGGTWFSKPKVPTTNNSLIVPSNLNIPNLLEAPGFSLRELYKNATPTTKSWYSLEYNTLWWIGVTIISVGTIYFGYQFIYNPIYDIFHVNKPTTNIQPPTPPSDGNNITIGSVVANTVDDFSRRIINIYNTTINTLNPFNYFVTSNELQAQFDQYMEIQNNYISANRKLYPFTEYNPIDPWYKKLRLQLFGESGKEFIDRNQLIIKADAVYESISVGKGKTVDVGTTIWSAKTTPWSTPSRVLSPLPNIIGLSSEATDAFNRATAGLTERKLASIPSTPKMGGPLEWASHIIDKSGDTIEELETRFREIKNPLPSSSNNPTIIEMSSSSSQVRVAADVLDSPSTVPNTPSVNSSPLKRDFFL